jgi:hypothetical protein
MGLYKMSSHEAGPKPECVGLGLVLWAIINRLGLIIGFHNVDWAYRVAIGLILFVGFCGNCWA